jgi:hypothetical protein
MSSPRSPNYVKTNHSWRSRIDPVPNKNNCPNCGRLQNTGPCERTNCSRRDPFGKEPAAPETFEYAGFQYTVDHTAGFVFLTPVAGQHAAAYKTKHLRNAMQAYRDAQKSPTNEEEVVS